MNDKNIYNQNEIKNKLQNFQEGQDYFVTPSKVPEIKDYTFFNDRLKSLFGGNNWIPVRVWQEKFDEKDFKYRGHFEEGKDYSYSAKHWEYGENYQGDYGAGELGIDWIKDIKWDKSSEVKGYAEAGNFHTGKKYWERSWTYTGKGRSGYSARVAPTGSKKIGPSENWEVENHRRNLVEWEEKRGLLKSKIEGLIAHIKTEHLIADEEGRKHDKELRELEQTLAKVDKEIRYHEDWLAKNESKPNILPGIPCATCGKKISQDQGHYICKEHQEHHCSKECAEQRHKCHMKWAAGDSKDNHSNLEKENFELRQQLASVQAELAKVLTELKKLTGKNEVLGKIEQQQVQNEKVMKKGSTTEMKNQVAKSQTLAREASTINTIVPVEKKEPKNSVLPYVAVGSLLVIGIGAVVIGWKKRNKK